MARCETMDTLSLPEHVIEQVLTHAARLALPVRDPRDGVQSLAPILNTLGRTCIPSVTYAIILACPWIDANVASVTNNLWLLNVLAHKLSKPPYNRPMQYDDERLLDKVSALGFLEVLDWWHNASGDYVIGQTNPIQQACNHGHPHVVDWWFKHGHRLGERFPNYKQDFFSLLVPTRKGDMATLQWWYKHKFEPDTTDCLINHRHGIYMSDSFRDLIIAAGTVGLKHVVDFWVGVAKRYCGVNESVMCALFACGHMDWIDEHLEDFDETDDSVELLDGMRGFNPHFEMHPLTFSVLSGNVEFIEQCLARFDVPPEYQDAIRLDMTVLAAGVGHVHVLDWLQRKRWIQPDALSSKQFSNYHRSHQTLLSHFKTTTEPSNAWRKSTPTLLHWIVYFGDVTVLEWWHRHHGVELHTLMSCSDDPQVLPCLELAMRQGHAALVTLLLVRWRPRVSLNATSACLVQAAARGHVHVFRAHAEAWAAFGCDTPFDDDYLNDILINAIFHGHLGVVEWWVSTWRVRNERMYRLVLSELLWECLDEGVPPRVVEWCIANGHRFEWDGVVKYSLYPALAEARLSTKDTLRLIGFHGQQLANSGKATFAAHADSRIIKSWRGQPIALQQLVNMRILSDRLDLDAAIESKAGTAVYDWMLGFRQFGKCRWSVKRGYRTLANCDQWNGLTWWAKKGLPVPPLKPKEDPLWDRDELDFNAPLALEGEDFW